MKVHGFDLNMKSNIKRYNQSLRDGKNFSARMTLIYFLLFVFFISLMSVLSYGISSRQMEKEVNMFADSLLDQVRINIDRQLKSIDDTVITLLGADNNVRMFINNTYNDKSEYQTSQMELQETLRFIQETNAYIHSIYVYSHVSRNLIAADNKLTEAEQFDNGWKAPSEGRAVTWVGTREITESIYDTNPAKVITAVRQFPFTLNTSRVAGRVVVNIDASILDEIMAYNHEGEQNKLVVCDESGDVILSSGGLSEVEPAYWNGLYDRAKEGKLTEKLEGSKYLVYAQKSENLGWKYLYLAHRDQIYAPLNQMRNSFLLTLVLILLFAFAVNIYLREFTYKPLDKFLRSVIEASKFTQKGKEVKVENVRDVEALFERMFNEHQTMLGQVRESVPALKWRILTDIILGCRSDIADIRTQLETLGISLGCENFIVMVIKADESSLQNYVNAAKNVSLYRTSLIALAEEEVNGETSGTAFELADGNVCVIISFETFDTVRNPAIVLSYAETIRMKSQESFGIPVTIGVGRLKRNAEDIKNSFGEASSALEYEILTGSGAIIPIEDIEGYDERGLYSLLFVINGIAQSLRTVGESNEYKDAVHGLYERFKAEKLSPQLIVQMSVQLIMQSIYVVVDLGIPIQKLLGEQYSNIYDILVDFPTLEELRDYVVNIIECFVENIRLKRNTKNINEKTIQRVLDFINEHYSDRRLSLNMLSAEFHFSAPYLSKLFKQATETNFLDYLINLRVKQAQDMLVNTNLSINEIAERVGYPTYHSFMQIFKKYTGTTPSEYRSTTEKQPEVQGTDV